MFFFGVILSNFLKHSIGAESVFSWGAAWLAKLKDPDPIVSAPKIRPILCSAHLACASIGEANPRLE